MKILLSLDEDSWGRSNYLYQLLVYLARDNENDIICKFKSIVSHQGPITSNHPDYNGSTYNLLIEWENGEITKEPLQVIAKDDPVTCAIYAKENGLLDLPGCKQFKRIARLQKKLTRMVSQPKRKSFTNAPKFKNGYKIPRTYKQVMQFDEKNSNTKWQDAIAPELWQINEYETFTDVGHHTKAKIPNGYKNISVHFVFDVKHDGIHKARLSVDGHHTEVPLELSTLESLVNEDSVYFLLRRIKQTRTMVYRHWQCIP
jgi:hypothetical protein